jgi:hypothetical protein
MPQHGTTLAEYQIIKSAQKGRSPAARALDKLPNLANDIPRSFVPKSMRTLLLHVDRTSTMMRNPGAIQDTQKSPDPDRLAIQTQCMPSASF